MGLGTDVAGGYSPSMLVAVRSTVIASRVLFDGVDRWKLGEECGESVGNTGGTRASTCGIKWQREDDSRVNSCSSSSGGGPRKAVEPEDRHKVEIDYKVGHLTSAPPCASFIFIILSIHGRPSACPQQHTHSHPSDHLSILGSVLDGHARGSKVRAQAIADDCHCI